MDFNEIEKLLKSRGFLKIDSGCAHRKYYNELTDTFFCFLSENEHDKRFVFCGQVNYCRNKYLLDNSLITTNLDVLYYALIGYLQTTAIALKK